MFRAEHLGSTAVHAVHADIAAPNLPPTPPAACRRLLGTPALTGFSQISNRGGPSWEDVNQANVLKAFRAVARA